MTLTKFWPVIIRDLYHAYNFRLSWRVTESQGCLSHLLLSTNLLTPAWEWKPGQLWPPLPSLPRVSVKSLLYVKLLSLSLSATFITLCPLETQRTNLISVFYDSQLFNYSFTHSTDLYWVTAICRHWECKGQKYQTMFPRMPQSMTSATAFCSFCSTGQFLVCYHAGLPCYSFLLNELIKDLQSGSMSGDHLKWFYRNLLTRAKGTHSDISPSRSSDEMMQSKSSSHHTWQQCFLFSIYWIKSKIIIPPPRPCPA